MSFFDKIFKIKMKEAVKPAEAPVAPKPEPVKTPSAPARQLNKKSQDLVSKCHPDIQKVVAESIKEYDFIVTDGWRGEAAQNEAYRKGNSKVKFPNSYHNCLGKHIKPEHLPAGIGPEDACSLAVDLVPLPVDWNDLKRFEELAKVIKKNADKLGIGLEHPFTWDKPHFELTLYRKKING